MTSADMAQHLARALHAAGAELVFGVPGGGANLDMVEAVQAAGCRFVLTHSETAATIMAGVVGELTGRPAAAVVTRGPGVASAVNGAAQALLDRQPVVLISDCVTSADLDRVSHQRLDQVAMLSPATKASVRLGPRDTVATATAVVALTTDGRPGPVHVDVDATASPSGRALSTAPSLAGGTPDPVDLEVARRALSASCCPVLIVGVGAVATSSVGRDATVAAVRRLVEQAAIPVLTTYKARGVVADASPCAAGLFTGATIESDLLHQADLIVGVGLDPVELIPGPWPYRAPVVLLGPWAIDDSRYFGLRLLVEVVGELAPMLDALGVDLTTEWDRGAGAEYRRWGRRRLLEAVPPSPAGLTPQQVVTVARGVAPSGTIATVDAGAHMLVAMPLWEVEQPGELLISSGLATMGFALPAAIAAALVHPRRHVVCFTGDGGLGMAMAELETVARLRLPVVVVVFNDATLSLIAIKQRADGHGGTDAVRYAPVDFAAIGAACGLHAERVGDVAAYERLLVGALEREGPTLLDVTVDPSGYRAVIEVIRGAPTTTAHQGKSSLD